jgi:hypothetical protein
MSTSIFSCPEKKNGCWWTGAFKDYLVHEETCEFYKTECSFENCFFVCSRREMAKHELNCPLYLNFVIQQQKQENLKLNEKINELEKKYESVKEELNEKNEIVEQLKSLLNDFKEALLEK